MLDVFTAHTGWRREGPNLGGCRGTDLLVRVRGIVPYTPVDQGLTENPESGVMWDGTREVVMNIIRTYVCVRQGRRRDSRKQGGYTDPREEGVMDRLRIE